MLMTKSWPERRASWTHPLDASFSTRHDVQVADVHPGSGAVPGASTGIPTRRSAHQLRLDERGPGQRRRTAGGRACSGQRQRAGEGRAGNPRGILAPGWKNDRMNATGATTLKATDPTDAIRERDQVRSATLRMVPTAVSNAEVAGKEHRELSDDEVLAVIVKEAKKRREAAIAYVAGAGRTELPRRRT